MTFDMPTFSKFARKAHRRAVAAGYTVYSLEDALAVFQLYFEWYEYACRRVHPNIRLEQIQRIIEAMPYMDDNYRGRHPSIEDIGPDYYEEIIPQHFKTKYRNCDYNINHFFSGDIRMLRFYETCY